MKHTLIAAALAAFSATAASADSYTLQSAFGGLPVLHPTAERFVANVASLTGGEVEFSYHKAGELSPPFEIFDNVSAGALDAAWSYAAYASGKEPAAALFGSVPFGGDPLSYVSWLHHGGGLELWQEIYAPYNLVPMACGVILSEAGGWYTKEINTPDDLQGLNIRIGGPWRRNPEQARRQRHVVAGRRDLDLAGDRPPRRHRTLVSARRQAARLRQGGKNYYFPAGTSPPASSSST